MKRHRLLVAVFASMALAGWSQDIIIESYADGQNSQAFSSVEGKWTESTAKSTAAGLTATKALFNDANTDPAVARFTPQIPATGQYEIFITYPTSGNASDIKYTVVSADGTKELSITQNGRDFGHTPKANAWHSIGTFNFNEGNSGYIEVRDPLTGEKPLANEPNARIYVDAIKLVPKGGSAPAAAGAVVSAETEAATAAMEMASATPAAATPASGATAALPSLPAATATPAAGDMPGLSAVQASPTPVAPIPGLPETTAQPGAAAQLPGLPSATPAADAVTALPALPGTTTTPAPAATEMPALPAATPETATAMPALPTTPTPAPGLPDLPSVAQATPGLPALPTADTAAAVVTETQTVTAQATPYPVPNLPSLAPVTPTPERTLPSVADTPVPGAPSGLPGGALTGIPSGPPSLMPPGTPSTDFSAPSVPGMPGTASIAPTPPPPGTSISEYNPANLQWMYDFGAALNTARAQNKKVLVFFTAEGNKAANIYETQYFTHPTLRQALNNYVLVKVDFPKNTRLGYSLGIFGAGIIVVADQTGDVQTRIEQLPSTPVDLLQQMTNPTQGRRTPGAGAAGTTATAVNAAGTTTP